jgi:ribosomal-protein-alanine N-acetyltransferase
MEANLQNVSTMQEEGAACTIRAARMEDLDAIFAIDTVCFPPEIAYPREFLRQLLCSPTSVPRVAVQGGELAGFAILEMRKQGLRPVGELVTIDVLEAARRKGVGQALHAAIERAVQQRGGRKIRLQVSVENAAAQRFYQRLGYRTRGRIPRYYNNTIDAWWMEKSWK